MSGYYPDGVTGNELAIAGVDKEWEEMATVTCQNDECEMYDEEVELMVVRSSYRNQRWTQWVCPTCDKEQEYEEDIEPEEQDPDDAYEAYRESMRDW
jgi:hypothetical protein